MASTKLTKEEWRERCGNMLKLPPLKPGRGRVLICREPSSDVLLSVDKPDGTKFELLSVEKFAAPAMRGILICHGEPALTAMGSKIPFWTEPGQLVTFLQYAGKQYVLDPYEFVVLPEEEIVAAFAR